jgi:nicotinate-nucleotide pyrophosphorylase (carboxylating)
MPDMTAPRVPLPPFEAIRNDVARALAEDVGTGDLSAGLVPADRAADAVVISRQRAVLCGTAWFAEVFRQTDPQVAITWSAEDGAQITSGMVVCRLHGSARSLLTGERAALNFLQTLSGTATVARRYADAVGTTATRILDTRKTIPGLRVAQKFAVRCGGCHNHRMGLFDAILIKENHIAAAGSVAEILRRARAAAPGGVNVEIEVEDLGMLDEALDAGADHVLLDNFSQADMREAVARCRGRARLEVSGDVTLERIAEIAAAGVDFISIGALTKHLQAVDLSMRFAG